MHIFFIEFKLPRGRKTERIVEIDDSLAEKYRSIDAAGLRFEIEQLRNSTWSLTLTDEDADWAFAFSPEEEGISQAANKLIREFNLDEYYVEKSKIQNEASEMS